MENTEKLYSFLDDFDVRDIELYAQWAHALDEFDASNSKAMKFTLANAQQKNRCRSAISSYCKRNSKDWTIYNEKNKYNIYVVRA